MRVALRARFNELREKQKESGERVDWLEEYAQASIPCIRRLLIKKELENTAIELGFHDEKLMYSAIMSKEMLDFILEWRKVLMDRMEMLNNEYLNWK